MSKLLPLVLLALFLAALASSAPAGSGRLRLVPRLRPGQKLAYLVSYESERTVKTQSRFATTEPPASGKLAAQGSLLVEVLRQDSDALQLRATFDPLEERSAASRGSVQSENAPPANPPPAKWVAFTLRTDGSVSHVTGLGLLPQELQAAWREWLARFAAPMAYPKDGVKRGEKWRTEELETSPSPIAGLFWHRISQYVRDEPCPQAGHTPQGDVTESLSKTETCVVIFTAAVLKQKSSPKDATPEDYKLHHLRTKGTASGENETILYISRATGLLMRSTESDTQSMDVVISLADGSNQVRYSVHATSHAKLLFLSAQAPAPPGP